MKDLRSQVVREACITVAYMSQVFSHKADRFVENLLQSIVNLIPNSAKVRRDENAKFDLRERLRTIILCSKFNINLVA